MKPVRDAILHFLRSIAGYVLFYYLLQLYSSISGIALWMYLLSVIILIELANLIITWLMKKMFAFDPLFRFQMPLLVYALYRMVLEMAFLIFLFAIFGFSPWLVLLVGALYFFGVLRHSARLNRMMMEGTPRRR